MKKEIMLPHQWEDWEIAEEIGSGAYGTVYKVRRRIGRVETISAVKVVSIPSDFSEAEYVARDLPDLDALQDYYTKLVEDYVREIRAMVSLEGLTNIVSIEDYVIEPQAEGIGSHIFIRMEYLQSFPEYAASQKLREADVIRLGIDMCTALSYCEEIRLVHRDIKPDNIFVSKHGDFKLGDFGIAGRVDSQTKTVSPKGTYTYMAPEVFQEQIYNARTDLYSLGLVLYRLVNNNKDAFINPMKQLVYSRDREDALQRRLRGEPLPKPSHCSEELFAVLQKACAYQPQKRYRSAREMKKALLAVLDKHSSRECRLPDQGIGDQNEPAGSDDYDRAWKIPVTQDARLEAPSNGHTDGTKITPDGSETKKMNAGRIWKYLLAAGIIAVCCFLIGRNLIRDRIHKVSDMTESLRNSSGHSQETDYASSAELSYFTELFDDDQIITTQIGGYRRILWSMKPDEAKEVLVKDGASCSIHNQAGEQVLTAVTKNSSDGIELNEKYYFSRENELKEVDATVSLLFEKETRADDSSSVSDLFLRTVELMKLFYGEPVRRELASGKRAAGWVDKDGDMIVIYTGSETETPDKVSILAFHRG